MRLIDADKLKKAYFNAIEKSSIGEVSIIGIIDNAPTVEPTFGVFKSICCEDCDKNKRPQGEWIHLAYDDMCSICKYNTGKYEVGGNYCPNCGADMRGKEE